MDATEKDKKAGDTHVAVLLTVLGPEAMDIYRPFEWAADAAKMTPGRSRINSRYISRDV